MWCGKKITYGTERAEQIILAKLFECLSCNRHSFRSFITLNHLILTATQRGKYYYFPHFPEEKMKAQRAAHVSLLHSFK